jgi:hypothetical protein
MVTDVAANAEYTSALGWQTLAVAAIVVERIPVWAKSIVDQPYSFSDQFQVKSNNTMIPSDIARSLLKSADWQTGSLNALIAGKMMSTPS